MTDNRLESANAVLNECFWGEYNLTAEDILERLDNDTPGFKKFIFSKIIENSHYPSRHIKNLFLKVEDSALIEKMKKGYSDMAEFIKRIIP